jgi:hypothetical protein
MAGRNPWDIDANRIFHSSVEDNTTLFISGLTFSNLFYLLSKTHGSKKTVQKLSAMRELVSVSPVDKEVVDFALEAGWADFEDALQYYSALSVNCDILITRNLSDYEIAGNENMKVMSPSAFVSNYLDAGNG